MYAKSRSIAEDVFRNYVQASCKLYHLDDKEMEVFSGNVSKSYILDFYMAWTANGE
jgi:hypothetical protein